MEGKRWYDEELRTYTIWLCISSVDIMMSKDDISLLKLDAHLFVEVDTMIENKIENPVEHQI